MTNFNKDFITEECSFIVENIDTKEISSFNINVFQNPKHNIYVGKKVSDEFRVPGTKITYKILKILPPGKALGYKLINKWKSYGFEGFIHTTEIENFQKIIECGYLHSRNYLEKKKIEFKDVAESGVLERTEEFVKNCCRFYYFYQTPTNHEAKYKKPIILVFDENIIYYGKGVFFAPENACYGNWTNRIDKAYNFEWDGIFERGQYSLSKYCNGKLSDNVRKKITRKRNAEFLIHGNVSIEDIKFILVKDTETLESLRTFCDENILSKVKISKKEF